MQLVGEGCVNSGSYHQALIPVFLVCESLSRYEIAAQGDFSLLILGMHPEFLGDRSKFHVTENGSLSSAEEIFLEEIGRAHV